MFFIYSGSHGQQLSSELVSACSQRLRKARWPWRAVAVCTEIGDGPARPLVGGSGNLINSFIVSSLLAKTTLHFMRNTEGVVAALSGQEWCHQCFLRDVDGPLIMVPLRRSCLSEEEGRIVTSLLFFFPSLLFFFPSLSPLKYSLGETKRGNETLSGLPQLWDQQSHTAWRRG